MHTIRSVWHAATPPASDKLEVMVFTLGEQEYGIDLQKVQELRSYDRVIPLAGAPVFFRGAIDLLGTRVPLIDMRIAVGSDVPALERPSDIVVIRVGERLMGAAVDVVVDVVTLTAAQISPPPSKGMPLHADCLFGIGTLDGRSLLLIDIDNFMRDAIAMLDTRAA
jgi:purine-binding chemotaxis protein CheW